jgi:hypothetical protein
MFNLVGKRGKQWLVWNSWKAHYGYVYVCVGGAVDGPKGKWESTPDPLPKPGALPTHVLKPHPTASALWLTLHLLQRVISTRPTTSLWTSCPAAPLSLIPPGLYFFLFLEQLCIIPSLLPFPFLNTPTCLLWFCASSWPVSRAKSNRCVQYWLARVICLSVQPVPDECFLSTIPFRNTAGPGAGQQSGATAFWCPRLSPLCL